MNGPKYAMERHERVDLPETANVRMPTHAWCTVFLARFRRLQYVRIRLLQCFHQPISLTADTCISFFLPEYICSTSRGSETCYSAERAR